jgi:hypothetical protein
MPPAPLGPAAPAPLAPHPGDGRPEPAELHHDWGDPPRPVPPADPPDREPRDAGAPPAQSAIAPWQRLPPPGRHGRVHGGPQPGDDERWDR